MRHSIDVEHDRPTAGSGESDNGNSSPAPQQGTSNDGGSSGVEKTSHQEKDTNNNGGSGNNASPSEQSTSNDGGSSGVEKTSHQEKEPTTMVAVAEEKRPHTRKKT